MTHRDDDRGHAAVAETVTAWLAQIGVRAEPPLRVARLGRGSSNLMFRIEDASGASWALRRPPFGQLLETAHDLAREHRVLSGLQGTHVPVPRLFAFTDDPSLSDAPLLLMELVEGRSVDDDASARALTEQQRRAASVSLVTTLAKIHAVDLDQAGLTSLASHAPYAPRQLKRWRRQWDLSKTGELPAIEGLGDLLERNLPEQRELTLVHGDYHFLNVLLDQRGYSVCAVLDWELCTLGDPIADLGGLLAYWLDADDAVIATPFPFTALPGFYTRAELVKTYAETSERDVSDVGFWHVLGCWKIAIIAYGVVVRRARDPANSGGSAATDLSIVNRMLERGFEAAKALGMR